MTTTELDNADGSTFDGARIWHSEWTQPLLLQLLLTVVADGLRTDVRVWYVRTCQSKVGKHNEAKL